VASSQETELTEEEVEALEVEQTESGTEAEIEPKPLDENGVEIEEPPEPTGDSAELLPIIPVGAWVRLKSDSKEIPEEAWGMKAAVEDAQTFMDPGLDSEGHPRPDAPSPRPTEVQFEDALFTVRTRGDMSLVFQCTRNAFEEVSTNGRQELEEHG
jgi:hypothetical protein